MLLMKVQIPGIMATLAEVIIGATIKDQTTMVTGSAISLMTSLMETIRIDIR
jgi:hypothetical protein